ncbi:pyridoxal-phosphate dependent enzyme [Nocardioides convexus]|uniref:pyridoxal-phosphate dependent enzyme n=1 Tax=Nocardioides convexus TaxID=2712224 RepID=UPI002418262B|nr:pyridoxal-phosphate dependent enzyme [Nocardioides convexus]
MKDRVARRVLTEARESGVLAEGAPVIESSSGTMALGLALAGSLLGHPVHIVTDPRIDPITLAKARGPGLLGARRRRDDGQRVAERPDRAADRVAERAPGRLLAASVLQPAEPARLRLARRGGW